jgi:hypothetical protein
VLRRTTDNTNTQDSPRLGFEGSHHLPRYSILCGWPRSPHPNGFLSHDSQVGVPKSPKLGLLRLWSPITLQTDLQSRCGLKKSCSSRQELSNIISHALCKQVNRVDSRLFLVRSQTASLTHGPSFGHNLCFRCPNEQCEPILNIYVPRAFQWYKNITNHWIFIPKIVLWSFGSPPGLHLPSGSCFRSVRVHSLTFSYTPRSMWCDSRASSWPATLQPLLPWSRTQG